MDWVREYSRTLECAVHVYAVMLREYSSQAKKLEYLYLNPPTWKKKIPAWEREIREAIRRLSEVYGDILSYKRNFPEFTEPMRPFSSYKELLYKNNQELYKKAYEKLRNFIQSYAIKYGVSCG